MQDRDNVEVTLENFDESEPLNKEEAATKKEENLKSPFSSEEENVASSIETSEEPKHEDRRWGKIKQIKEERNAYAAEVEALRQQNEEMQSMLQNAYATGAHHYGQNVSSSFDKAKENLALAHANNDPYAIAEATAELAAATNDLTYAHSMLNNQGNNNSANLERSEQLNYAPPYLVDEWFEENPELDVDSPEFDESLAKPVLSFVQKINNRLERNNQQNLKGSPQYLELIDQYIDSIKGSKDKGSKHFGAVRSRYSGTNVKDNRQISLTKDQKEAAAAFNMTEEKYASWLKKYTEEDRK